MSRKKKKIIVFSLFDSEHDTVKKSLHGFDCDVYSFGIGSGTGHINLDLSDFCLAKRELDKYPKPDIVFGFPPCETWCFVSVGSKCFYTSELGINLYWKNKWTPFDFTDRHIDRRMNGENTLKTLVKIINHFKPKHWFIENGTRSLAFSYLNDVLGLRGYKNLTNYYSYGFDYLKPTTIYSNIELQLKRKSPVSGLRKVKSHILGKSKSEIASLRSRVPFCLVSDIFSQSLSGGVPCLFPEFEL
jgi:hypothetical protein